MIYLDSSALVKLIISEQETVALHMYLSEHGSTLLTCELALTEVLRVVRRSCYNPQRQLQVSADVLDQRMNATGELLDSIDRIVVDTDTFLRASMAAGDPHLGTLDAIHLVCAIEVGPELTAFITYDQVLARAAERQQLRVTSPQ